MTTRPFDFTGASIDSSAQPTTEDAAEDSDVAPFSQTAERDFWFNGQADNAAIKAISVADRNNNQCCLNEAKAAFYCFDADSVLVDDGDLVLQPDTGSGRWLKITGGSGVGGSADILVQDLDSHVSTIRASEDISANDALGLELFDQDDFLLIKTDSDIAKRRNSFLGFATAAATVTQGIYTLTLDAALVTSNLISIDLNGTTYTETFASSSDETWEALRVQLDADPDVDTAVITVEGGNQTGSDDRVMTLTSGNGLSATGAVTILVDAISITLGASQPGLVFATSTTAASATPNVHNFGPLDGFSSLTVGDDYFVSPTAGGITNAPLDASPIFAGQSISTTQLFVHPFRRINAYEFSKGNNFIKSHGSSTQAPSGGTSTTELFNFGGTWSIGAVQGTGNMGLGIGESSLGNRHYVVDGINTSNSNHARNDSFNGSVWATNATKATNTQSYAIGNFSSNIVVWRGSTSNSQTGASNNLQEFNGSVWNDQGSPGGSLAWLCAGFTQGGLFHSISGTDAGASSHNRHETWNGTVASTDTLNLTGPQWLGAVSALGGMTGDDIGGATGLSFEWNGTVWGSSVSLGRVASQQGNGTPHAGCGSGFFGGDTYAANGEKTAAVGSTDFDKYNGTVWAAETVSTQGKSGPQGSVL